MYEALKHPKEKEILSRDILMKLINHKYFQESLLTFLNKGTLLFHFRNPNNTITPLQSFMKYLLSDKQKHHQYFYDFYL